MGIVCGGESDGESRMGDTAGDLMFILKHFSAMSGRTCAHSGLFIATGTNARQPDQPGWNACVPLNLSDLGDLKKSRTARNL